jgi:hypothetical protein
VGCDVTTSGSIALSGITVYPYHAARASQVAGKRSERVPLPGPVVLA